MNTFAAFYALSKLKNVCEKRLKALKDSIIVDTLASAPDEEERISNRNLLGMGRGFYRVSFGGVSSSVFYDGSNYAIMYKKTPKRQTKKISIKGKEELIKAFNLSSSKKPNYEEILKKIKESYPGIVEACDISISASTSVVAVQTAQAPSIGEAMEAIGNDFYEQQCVMVLDLLEATVQSPVRAYGILQQADKTITELSDFLKEVCKSDFGENAFVKMTTTERLTCDTDKLSIFVENNSGLDFSPIVNKKEGDPKESDEASYTIRWAGLASDMTGTPQSDLLQALDAVYIQSKGAVASNMPIFSREGEESRQMNKIPTI